MTDSDTKISFLISQTLGDILRALGCNVTNAAVAAQGGTEEPGQKRIAFADFGAILSAVKADTSSTGCKEDYIEGLKVGFNSLNQGETGE